MKVLVIQVKYLHCVVYSTDETIENISLMRIINGKTYGMTFQFFAIEKLIIDAPDLLRYGIRLYSDNYQRRRLMPLLYIRRFKYFQGIKNFLFYGLSERL
jgi:hypothetical protein